MNIGYEYKISKLQYNNLLHLVDRDKFKGYSKGVQGVIDYLNATTGLNRKIISLKFI